MAGDCAIDAEKYALLEDFNVDAEVEKEEFQSFSLCFWVYLLDSTTYPSTIIRQVTSRLLKATFSEMFICWIHVFNLYSLLTRWNWG